MAASADFALACTSVPGGTAVALRVIPRAGRTGITGLHAGAVRLRVAAPPVDGRANAAVEEAIAEVLGVRGSAVSVVRGERSRSKVVRIDGVSADDVAARLAAAAR